jgi:hypothetical protein
VRGWDFFQSFVVSLLFPDQSGADPICGRDGVAMPVGVRSADTDRHGLAPEAAGLHAHSLGFSVNFSDDKALLEQGLIVYDAFYAWASRAKGARQDWRPAAA